jgi:transposase
MRPKGSALELEVRRRIAGQLLLEGRKIEEVAQIVKATSSAVKKWKAALKAGGLDSLKSKPHPGREPRLGAKEKGRLLTILKKGAVKAGFRTELWTCSRVAQVVQRQFGVAYHPSHVWKILRGLGLSPQKPEQRARERDEAEIVRWREQEWPRIKKGVRKSS